MGLKENDPAKKWNKLIYQLIRANWTWNQLQEIAVNAGSLENFPVEVQTKLAHINIRMHFDVALPELVRYWTTGGGLEALLLPVERTKNGKDPN